MIKTLNLRACREGYLKQKRSNELVSYSTPCPSYTFCELSIALVVHVDENVSILAPSNGAHVSHIVTWFHIRNGTVVHGAFFVTNGTCNMMLNFLLIS